MIAFCAGMRCLWDMGCVKAPGGGSGGGRYREKVPLDAFPRFVDAVFVKREGEWQVYSERSGILLMGNFKGN